ncbi:putative universal stress protein A [Medicago truncatula]|uniref:Putative universal stress protein A n=1 Tax=Medicago truncatula TaxID=3880 RepID=G7I9H1_MEDTR|nr:universal stress protein A-like protein [Medicago truncatula]AES61462.1 universal stress family protein [Medicago truncatula]RHN80846.1 putative universal stress protein A [Medicago truncatula]
MAGITENGRRIMVAIDEGEESIYALTWCLKNLVFQNSKDHLILLYVKPPRVVYSAFDGTGYLFSSDITATMEKYSQQVADCVLEKAKIVCNDVQNVETRIENGDPRDVICQAVQKMGVDILVMGSHGYGVIKRAFLGSVSNHCAQNVKCPVLIVKKPKSTTGGDN